MKREYTVEVNVLNEPPPPGTEEIFWKIVDTAIKKILKETNSNKYVHK